MMHCDFHGYKFTGRPSNFGLRYGKDDWIQESIAKAVGIMAESNVIYG